MTQAVRWFVVVVLCLSAACGQKPSAHGTRLAGAASSPAPTQVAERTSSPQRNAGAERRQPAPVKVAAAAPATESAPAAPAREPQRTPREREDRSPDKALARQEAPDEEKENATRSAAAELPPDCEPIEFPRRTTDPSEDVVLDVAEYGQRHPDAYAEMWLWGDSIRIAFTGDLAEHEQRLARVIRDRYPFEVVKAEWSHRELRGVQRRIVDAMQNGGRVAGASMQGVGVDVVHNIVTVMLDRVDAEVRREMARRFPTPQYCLEEGTMGPAETQSG